MDCSEEGKTMTRQEAVVVLQKLDPLDEDELITLPDCEIDRYRRAIEVAYGGTCAPPVSRHGVLCPATTMGYSSVHAGRTIL